MVEALALVPNLIYIRSVVFSIAIPKKERAAISLNESAELCLQDRELPTLTAQSALLRAASSVHTMTGLWKPLSMQFPHD